MPDPPKQLGPYHIDREIGRGGMGVVYLGHDTRLDRPVAIKTLPEHLAADPDRMARFQREAKLLASLTHPNIAGVYGLEEHDGAHYLIMEFVEGESLAQIIARNPIAIEETLRICAQVASGLEAAHESGVIHRDLKPGNIVVTPEGKAKVLDFGLAKEVESQRTNLDLSQTPTASIEILQSQHTAEGQIMGTPAYLSPEQARGKALDKRTDIWSFGCVLFECLTGLSPFRGESSSDSIGAILHKEPEWTLLPPATPAIIHLLLKRCLTKDASRRLRDIGDARVELNETLINPSGTNLTLASAALTQFDRKEKRKPAYLAWTVAAMLAIGGAYAAWNAWLTPEPQPQPKRLLATVGVDEPLRASENGQFVIAPDGNTLAFCAGKDRGSTLLYIRSLDTLEAKPLSGTKGAKQPFFSPDGQWIGFFADEALKKVSISGGAPLTLCETSNNPRGASWGDDGTIVFAGSTTEGLSRVRDTGGAAKPLTKLEESVRERSHRWPEVLPGSKGVLFTTQTMGTGFDEANIEVFNIETGKRTVLYRGGSYPRFAASGHLLFGHGGTLFAAPFDAKRQKMLAQPAPVIEGVVTEPPNGGVHMTVATDGTLVFNSGEITGAKKLLVFVDRDGTTTPIDATERDLNTVAISPDGERLAVQLTPEGQATYDIWTYEINRKVLSRLTFGEGNEFEPIWSPDGERIVFAANDTSNPPNLYIKRADGSDEPVRLTTHNDAQFPTDWSPDGRYVLFSEQSDTTKSWDLTVLDMNEDPPTKTTLFETPFQEYGASFSPNGNWIAYASDESGAYEVYVRAFPGPGGRWQVSTEGGGHPRWSPDGAEIIYLNGNQVMSAPVVSDSDQFSVGNPTELFSPGPAGSFFYPRIDFMPDGKQFVMLQNTGDEDQQELHQLTFVFNWFEELKQRIGNGGR